MFSHWITVSQKIYKLKLYKVLFFKEMIALISENRPKSSNTICGKDELSLILNCVGPVFTNVLLIFTIIKFIYVIWWRWTFLCGLGEQPMGETIRCRPAVKISTLKQPSIAYQRAVYYIWLFALAPCRSWCTYGRTIC
jgi:hypothetical protein